MSFSCGYSSKKLRILVRSASAADIRFTPKKDDAHVVLQRIELRLSFVREDKEGIGLGFGRFLPKKDEVNNDERHRQHEDNTGYEILFFQHYRCLLLRYTTRPTMMIISGANTVMKMVRFFAVSWSSVSGSSSNVL